MPQLDILTYVSQFSWFFILFNLFYFLTLYQGLPKLFKILKTRKLLLADSNTDSTAQDSNKVVAAEKTVGSPALDEAVVESKRLLREANTKSKAWVQTSLAQINKTQLKGFNTKYLTSIALKEGKLYRLSH